MENANKDLVGKTKGKSPLGRPRRRQEDNVKLNIKRNRLEEGTLDLFRS